MYYISTHLINQHQGFQASSDCQNHQYQSIEYMAICISKISAWYGEQKKENVIQNSEDSKVIFVQVANYFQ